MSRWGSSQRSVPEDREVERAGRKQWPAKAKGSAMHVQFMCGIKVPALNQGPNLPGGAIYPPSHIPAPSDQRATFV